MELKHGSEIAQYLNVTLGMLLKKSLEKKLQILKESRTKHTRKVGRKEAKHNILRRFMVEGDPKINKY